MRVQLTAEDRASVDRIRTFIDAEIAKLDPSGIRPVLEDFSDHLHGRGSAWQWPMPAID